MSLPELINFYHDLTPERVGRFAEFYTENAYFKDPFNEVHSLDGIKKIFSHMFKQVAEPRFTVVEQLVADNGVMLVWEFHFRAKMLGKCAGSQMMRGVSHLRFASDGRVNYHRDYWDAAEELYMKLPAVGLLMRGLRRALATP